MAIQKCPIWNVDCDVSNPYGSPDIYLVRGSHRAGGEYEISASAVSEIDEASEDADRARLTSILVERRMKGVDVPRLTEADVLRARESKPLPVHERAERLLIFLVRSSSNEIGQFLHIGESNPQLFQPALAWSESTQLQELHFLSDYLERLSLIERRLFAGYMFGAKIEVPGYQYVQEVETNPDSSQCFVAMWFDPSMDEAYEKGIRPAIEEDSGYSALRIDRREFLGKIDDEIVAQIRRSRFLVVDATHGEAGVRGGVYYEAGFAHGLGLSVIFTCRNDMIDKVHFDTRQFNHIVWENPDDLREQLSNRIGSVLGDGPNRTN